jgi:RNA polymerase sigma-70 factor (ECF subfamily)
MTQETWIKVYERIDAYDPAQPFQSWLLAIHRNHCLSHLRRASVRRETAVGDMAILELRPIEGHDAPLEILQRQEFAQRLRQAMAGLTASQQRVFGQVDLEQTEQKEAARILGMNAATLRSTLHAARKRLAGILVRMEATP